MQILSQFQGFLKLSNHFKMQLSRKFIQHPIQTRSKKTYVKLEAKKPQQHMRSVGPKYDNTTDRDRNKGMLERILS